MTQTSNAVKINRAYKSLYTSKKRYHVLTGSRGSLKSTSVHDYLARLSYEKGIGVLFSRWTLVSAKVSIIPEFREALIRMNAEHDFYITNNKVINKRSGSFILFMGIKSGSNTNTARLKSISGINTWVIEESSDFEDEKIFDIIDDSIRMPGKQNRVILILNPTTKEHWIYKRWFEGYAYEKDFKGFDVTMSSHPLVNHIHTTYHIAANLNYLSSDWIAKANQAKIEMEKAIEKADDKDKYAAKHGSAYYQTYIGGWVKFQEGAVYKNWTIGEFDESLPYGYGLDYGYYPDPLACVRIAVDWKRGIIYVDEIIYETEIDDVAARLEAEGISRGDFIVCDTNEPRTTANINMKFTNVMPAKKKKGSVVQGIRDIKKMDLVVTQRSKNVLVELAHYIWMDNKDSVPSGDYNHAMDAMRYIFTRMHLNRLHG